MAIGVVVVLEVIHVQQHDRKISAAAASTINFFFERGVHQAPIAQPGKLINIGQVCQLATGITQLFITIPKGSREITQLLRHGFPLPVEGNHIAKGHINPVADHHQHRTKRQ